MKKALIFLVFFSVFGKSEAICPVGWDGVNSVCFALFTKQLSWTKAKAECNKTDSEIASHINNKI